MIRAKMRNRRDIICTGGGVSLFLALSGCDVSGTSVLLSSLTRDDFESYCNDGCEQVWTPSGDGT